MYYRTGRPMGYNIVQIGDHLVASANGNCQETTTSEGASEERGKVGVLKDESQQRAFLGRLMHEVDIGCCRPA